MTRRFLSRWRWPAATALSATAAIHIALVPSHLREAPYAGALFIALSASALVVAILLLAADDRLAWMTAAGLSTLAALGYLVSRSIGLPSMGDDIGDWVNPLGVAALGCEAAVIVMARLALSAAQPRRISSTGAVTSTGPSPSR
jgi:hypothetical protein